MPQSELMSDIDRLTPDEWPRLRDIRLTALRESPHAFLATYEKERLYGQDEWLAEFDRGSWHVGLVESEPVSLLGVTREPDTPSDECFLEYIWVSPKYRRSRIAFEMLGSVIDGLRSSGVRTVFLWVLDGNDAAVHLYQQVGFVRTNHSQPLAARPGRSEERMRLILDSASG